MSDVHDCQFCDGQMVTQGFESLCEDIVCKCGAVYRLHFDESQDGQSWWTFELERAP